MGADDHAARVERVLNGMRALNNDAEKLDEAIAQRFGVNRTDLRCMDIVAQRGEVAAGELVAATGLTTGAITAMIDRMERAGYLLRRRDPEDRRRVLVQTAPDTRRVASEVFGELTGTYRKLVATYSDHDLDVIAGFLAASREIYGRQADRLRGHGDQV